MFEILESFQILEKALGGRKPDKVAFALLFVSMLIFMWAGGEIYSLMTTDVEVNKFGYLLPFSGVCISFTLLILALIRHYNTSTSVSWRKRFKALQNVPKELNITPEQINKLIAINKAFLEVEKEFNTRFDNGILKEGAIKGTGYSDPTKDKLAIEAELSSRIQEKINQVMRVKPGTGENIIHDTEDKTRIDPNKRKRWILDAVDGSSHLINGIPLYCSSICYQTRINTDEPWRSDLAAIYVPATKEFFFAVKGEGAYLNGWKNKLPISHHKSTDLKNSIFYLEFPGHATRAKLASKHINRDAYKITEKLVALVFKVAKKVRGFNMGSFGISYVAKGSFDAYISIAGTTSIFDSAAGLLIAKESGCHVSTKTVVESEGLGPESSAILVMNDEVYQDLLESNKSPEVALSSFLRRHFDGFGKMDNELYATAEDIVRSAGILIMENYGHSSIVSVNRNDFTTDIDKIVDQYIFNKLTSTFPDYSYDSEEREFVLRDSDFTWVLDPIDGTKYFHSGINLFTISLSLKLKEEIVFGIVYDPVGNEFYSSASGATMLNDGSVSVSEEKELSKIKVVLEIPNLRSDPSDLEYAMEAMTQLTKSINRVRILGVGAISLAYCSKGSFDVYLNLSKTRKHYDYSGGIGLVEQAGGICYENDNFIIAGNQKNVSKIMELLELDL